MQIPTSSPNLTIADVEAVTSVLNTRYLSLGPQPLGRPLFHASTRRLQWTMLPFEGII